MTCMCLQTIFYSVNTIFLKFLKPVLHIALQMDSIVCVSFVSSN